MSTAVKKFVFGPFMENTYVLHDETKECVIVDPGCFDRNENEELKSFIEENDLRPVRMLLTHSHLDHIMGCQFVHKTWGLIPEVHFKDEIVYRSFESSCIIFQIHGAPTPPEPKYSIREGEDIEFGNTRLKVHFVP
jgi:glyoxylase-like metal-dependent hydrolase (beta-lactamase superfamily II)